MGETIRQPSVSSEVNVEPVTEDCPCAGCSGTVCEWDGTRRVVVNNVHGELQPCENCGHPKTEYRDLGRKGVFECWWCTKRAEALA